MGKWEISKTFEFCYGHRVWSQELHSEYSLDSCLKCRHIHGHQGTIMIYLEGDSLQSGMVTDFKHLNWFKKWLDDTLDHKFIIDINDPLIDSMFPLHTDLCNKMDQTGGCKVFNESNLTGPIKEIYEGLVIVPFVPTSENLSHWIWEIAQNKMDKLGVKVSRVQFYETPKSQSNYYNI